MGHCTVSLEREAYPLGGGSGVCRALVLGWVAFSHRSSVMTIPCPWSLVAVAVVHHRVVVVVVRRRSVSFCWRKELVCSLQSRTKVVREDPVGGGWMGCLRVGSRDSKRRNGDCSKQTHKTQLYISLV